MRFFITIAVFFLIYILFAPDKHWKTGLKRINDFYHKIGLFFCKLGKHNFSGKKYFCRRCKKPRNWPKLNCIDGEKKYLKFPKL